MQDEKFGCFFVFHRDACGLGISKYASSQYWSAILKMHYGFPTLILESRDQATCRGTRGRVTNAVFCLGKLYTIEEGPPPFSPAFWETCIISTSIYICIYVYTTILEGATVCFGCNRRKRAKAYSNRLMRTRAFAQLRTVCLRTLLFTV